jgi:hypothetical protein
LYQIQCQQMMEEKIKKTKTCAHYSDKNFPPFVFS